MQKIVITAPGSLGDVNPMLAIAKALTEAGHEVLFLAAERYLHLAERAGLESKALVDEEQFARFAANPKLWHPRHGAKLIFREVVADFLKKHFQWLEQYCVPGETVLVSHILDFAGRVYRDLHPETTFISALPAPALLRSTTEPPRLSHYFWERWYPASWMPLAYRAADWWIDRIGAKQINAMRTEIGLPPIKRMIDRWWWSPDLVLCMFPEWFSIPPGELLSQMELTGFPLADSARFVAPQIKLTIEKIVADSGSDGPIVFAPGTAHHHAKAFLTSANEACRILKRRGVLISTDSSQFPDRLAPGVVAAEYLPFSELLPHARAIVHHGGVGTTSQALRAGVPQVVVPMAFDQFDNAERTERLGCGSWLPMRRVNTSRLTKALDELQGKSQNCKQIALRLSSEPRFETTVVRRIENAIARKRAARQTK